MPEPEIQIARDGEVLGSLPESDVVELLRLGFFRPEDHYLRPGMTASRPLSELSPSAVQRDSAAAPASWIKKARKVVVDTSSNLAHTAQTTAGRLRTLATQNSSAATQAANRFLEGYVPQIRTAVSRLNASKPIQTIRTGVQNDEMMRKTFGAVYDCLPKPVCRFISEERFIAFCLKRRNGLLGIAVPSEKKDNESQANPHDAPPSDGV
jgi:hypothetical protein